MYYLSIGVLVPSLIGLAFVLPLLGMFVKNIKFFHVYASAASLYALIVAIYNFNVVVREGVKAYPFGGWWPPIGISYEVDEVNSLIALLTASVMFLITLYSTWYIRDLKDAPYYYTLLLGLEVGMLGCIYTGDAFNLFVMLEVMSISAYALVGFYRNKPEAIEAAIKYGLFGAVATTLYFIGLVFIYASFGTLNMADLTNKATLFWAHNLISGPYYGQVYAATAVALALSLWAFTFKSAVFPNHFWLPDAHPEAPTPVSAALSGLVVNVGVYAIFRFFYTIFNPFSVLSDLRDLMLLITLVLGIASGLIGAFMMAVQDDIKRLLAYSTISHIGLILVGLSIGSSLLSRPGSQAFVDGLTGAFYHLINHSIGKSLLFLASGVIIYMAGGTRKLDELGGVARKNPVLGVVLVVGVLQLLGIPPFGGFFSKYLLYASYLEAGAPYISVIINIVSAVSLLGYVRLLYAAFFTIPRREFVKTSMFPSIILLVLSVACLMTGLLSPTISDWLRRFVDATTSKEGILNYWLQGYLVFWGR
ncbi:MAG: proton-conducting transporter membrane subunit [Zestosphaera sp.]